MALRYLLPALAVASRAAAEVCSGTTTINSQAEATALATCQQFTGNIVIGANTNGEIDLNGIERIEGSLVAQNVMQMTSLSADSLSTISDTFRLTTVSALSSLTFPSLVSVDAIIWEGLPNLQGLSFTQQVQKASILSIQNTQLYTLEGIDLQEIDQLYITNNDQLNEINMQLTNVTSALVITSNGRDTSVAFADMKAAANMTIQNVASINIDSLAYVPGALGFRDNSFSSLSAPNLTAVGQSLSFAANPELSKLDLPELTEVKGGIVVANNSHLDSIDGFPRLTNLFGNIDFLGVFKSVSLPKLRYVEGAFYVESTQQISSSCTPFATLHNQGRIKGNYQCGTSSTAGTKGGSLSGSSPGGTTSSGSSSSGHSGANSLLIPYATGIIGVVAAIFGML